MLDVHLPHGKLHGFWEFLLHLFTISVGLLIATQIESCVEWRHHDHLAEQARVELRAEITKNLKDLEQAQTGLKVWRQMIDSDLVLMQKIQEHPNDPLTQHFSLNVSASGMTLEDTAWRTAQSTGALAYMPYEEAERYSSIYKTQAALVAMEDKPEEDAAAITGLIAKFHWSESTRKINAEQASAIAERLGVMRWHLAVGDGKFQECIEQEKAFLENRKAREDFQENLK
jgi:hypothetical protein